MDISTKFDRERENKINKRLVFKIEDEYKLELHMPETMKLLIHKTKNRENVRSTKVIEVVSHQYKLVDDQYQQKE